MDIGDCALSRGDECRSSLSPLALLPRHRRSPILKLPISAPHPPTLLSSPAVRLLLWQLCRAIAFLHSKGVVYRDIKPENMLLSDEGELRLCDFGFARRLDVEGCPWGGVHAGQRRQAHRLR